MDHQSSESLFETAEPSPTRSANGDEFLKDAREFAFTWIHRTHGSASDFVSAMETKFGSMIRMHMLDIVGALRGVRDIKGPIREFLTKTLEDWEILVALGERRDRPREIASLDELFGRSRKLQTTAKYLDAVRFCSKFKKYSPYNNLLMFLQNPEATFWATASHWRKAFGRSVKDDARATLILAPMTPVLFVYDVVDTEGPELPQWFNDPFEVSGEFSQESLTRTLQNCERLRIQVVFKQMGMLHGGTAMTPPIGSKIKIRIELKQGEATATSYATLCHELAHVLLGHLGSDEDGWWPSRLGLPHPVRELEAESVAWLVCNRAGLKTKSDEYLAGYLESPEQQKLVSVDMVAKAASKIEELAERLLPVKQTKAERAKKEGPQKSAVK